MPVVEMLAGRPSIEENPAAPEFFEGGLVQDLLIAGGHWVSIDMPEKRSPKLKFLSKKVELFL